MKLLNALKKFVGATSVVLFIVEISCVLFQIISRNLTGRSYATVEEFVILLLPYFAMFAATYTMYGGNHVQIEFFYNKLPKNIRRLLYITLQLAMILAICLLISSSHSLAMKQWKIPSAALGWPNGIRFLCFVVTGPFMLPLFVHSIYRALHRDIDETQLSAAVRQSKD